jgi:hypothetical protein
MRSDIAYKSLQALAIGLLLVLAVGILKIGVAAYIAFAFCGSFVIFVTQRGASCTTGETACRTRHDQQLWRDALISGALGLAFAGVYHLSHGATGSYFGSEIAAPGAFLGMGAVQLLAIRWIWAPAAAKRTALTNLLRGALIPLLCMGSMIAVGLAAYLTPVTYDQVIYAFDLHLDPVAPSWKIGTLFRNHLGLYLLCGHVYNSLPLALSACLALQWREKAKRFPVDLGVALMALGVAGFALYQICPASGPVYLFPQDFPAHVPAISNAGPAPLPTSPRNGMPSLHVGWTFLLFWNLRSRRILGPLAAIFLVLTALATLGSGEHYLADLMVAIPLALSIQSAALKSANKWRLAALITGCVFTLAWLIAFRTGAVLSLPSGGALWAIAAATIVLPLALAWRSERAAFSTPSKSTHPAHPETPIESAAARLVQTPDAELQSRPR